MAAPLRYNVRYAGGQKLGTYGSIMPAVAHDSRMASLGMSPESIERYQEAMHKGIESSENFKTLRDMMGDEAEARGSRSEAPSMGPAGPAGQYRAIEKPGGEDPDTNIASAVRSFGRNFVPGADYVAAAGAWLENPSIPFSQHLVEQRYWNKQAERDMPGAAMAGTGVQAAALPASKAVGVGGALSRIGQTAAVNAAMDLSRGEDPGRVAEAAKHGMLINAGLEVASPWVGHLLANIPEASQTTLRTSPVHAGLVADTGTARALAAKAREQGGFTWAPGRDVTSGYALSTSPERGAILPDIGTKSLGQYANRQEGRLMRDPNAVIGGWRNSETGKRELDVSKVLQNREEALRQAAAAKQLAIYDLGAHQTIPVPGSGFGVASAAAPVAAAAPVVSPELAAAHQVAGRTAAQTQLAERDVPKMAGGGWAPPPVAPEAISSPGQPDLEAIREGVRSGQYQTPNPPAPAPGPYDASGVIDPSLRTPGGYAPVSLGSLGEAGLSAAHTLLPFHPSPSPKRQPQMMPSHGQPPTLGASHTPMPPGGFDFGMPPPPQAFDPYAGILGMMQPPSGAINEIARSQKQMAEQTAQLEGSKAAWAQEQTKWYNDARSKIDTDYQSTVQDYRNSHIDPSRVFSDKSIPQKAMTMIGMILGGMGSGLTGQPNMAANMVQRQIELDLQAQVQEMDKKKNLVAMNYEKYGNLDQALRVSYMQQSAFYESKIHQIAATSNAAQAMPQAQVALWKLREPLIPVMVQMAQYQGLQNMIRSGGHVVGDMPAPWDWNQYMATAMPGPGGRTTFARSAEDRKSAVEGLQKWDAYGQAVQQLAQHRDMAAALPLTDAQHQYDQYREATILSLANAMGVGRGEALKMTENIVPGSFAQFARGPESLQALRDIGANGKWSIWETHGSLHRPNLRAR